MAELSTLTGSGLLSGLSAENAERSKYCSLRLFAFSLSIAISACILYANRSFYHDDAYITLRYVKNFIGGYGLSLNQGDRVQGYSNFLHLALVSALGCIGIDLVFASQMIGILAACFLVFVLQSYIHKFDLKGPQEIALWHLPVILTASSAPIVVWSLGGLEGTLFALLTSIGCFSFLAALDCRQSARQFLATSGMCFGLSYLTHPNGLVFLLASLSMLVIVWRTNLLKNAVAFAVPCIVLIVPYTLWQVIYYGDVVPNTFYAKAGNFSLHRLEQGLGYLVTFIVQPPFLPILLLGALVYGFLTRKLRCNLRITYLALVIASYSSYILFIGGDHMRACRLFLPLIVPMSYLLYILLVSLVDATNEIVVFSVTAAILILSSLQLLPEQLNPKGEDPASYYGTIVGKYISSAWPEGALVAISTAGSAPFYATKLRYIDMLGLNDRHIAKRHIEKIEMPWQNEPGHLKGDGEYVLSLNPDYIIIGPSYGFDISTPWFLSDLEIGRDPNFDKNYAKHQVTLDHSGKNDAVGDVVFTYYQRVLPSL